MRLMYTHRAIDGGKFFFYSPIDPNISLSDLLVGIFKTPFAPTFPMID